MKTTVLVFHPNLETSRVNKELAQAVLNDPNHDVTVRDEYATYPDGRIDVAAEQRLVEDSDRIVLQFPFYWYSSPSLLKLWEDKVLEYGWAYGSTGHAFEGKEIMLAVSAGSGEADYQHDGSHHATMEELLKPFETMADYVGARYLPPFVVYGVGAGIDDDTLATTARRYAQVINEPAK